MSLTCPSCLQPYLKIATLPNPLRTVYVHHQDGESGEPTDWCISANRKGSGNHKTPELLAAIAECNRLNAENIKKSIASQHEAVVEFNRSSQIQADLVCKLAQFDMAQSRVVHLTDQEKERLAQREKTKMAFVGFDFAKAREQFPKPTGGAGRLGKPSVAISYQGRMTFSSEVSKVFEGCTIAMPSKDKENPRRILIMGYSEMPKGKENSMLALLRAKPNPKTGKVGSKSVTINGELLLKILGYDYKVAGNQTFEVEKFDAEKHTALFTLPEKTPTPKPKVARVKKAKPAPTAGANGAAASVAAAEPAAKAVGAAVALPAANTGGEDDLVIDQ